MKNINNRFLTCLQERMPLAFFFDMDGTLMDTMRYHSQAWEEVMTQHGFQFSARDCYKQEGRTGEDMLNEWYLKQKQRPPIKEEIREIYQQKTKRFEELRTKQTINGAPEVVEYVRNVLKAQTWVVTGSAMETLPDELRKFFQDAFPREKMIMATDVKKCKPSPEPYLTAWKRCGLPKEQCCVIENAPLGIRSAKSAGLFAIAVNTGPLENSDFENEKADVIFKNMHELLYFLKNI